MSSNLRNTFIGLLTLSTAWFGVLLLTSTSSAGLIFRFPPNPGPPGRRLPGGSRPGDRCVEQGLTLVALMPKTSYGLTVSARPHWYFYLPTLQADRLQFQVFDPQTQELQRQSFIPPTEEGIVEIQAQSDLEPNRSYIWSFSIICNQQNRSKDIVVTGTLERQLKPKLLTQLEDASVIDRLSLLSEAGLWHDTLRELATLRSEDPQHPNWIQRWTELFALEDVAFDSVSSIQQQRLHQANFFSLQATQSSAQP